MEMYWVTSSPHPHHSKVGPRGYLQVLDCHPQSYPHPQPMTPCQPPGAISPLPSNAAAGLSLQQPTALPSHGSESGPPVGPQPSLSPSPRRSLMPGAGTAPVPISCPAPGHGWDGPYDGPLDLWELLVQAGGHQGALGKTNESSHLRHMVLLCTLLLLLLLNEQLLLLPAPGCSQFFKASLHLLQHLGSVAYHQLDTVLSCLQQLHCLLVVFPFHALGAGRIDSVRKMLLWFRALPSFWYGKAAGVLESFHP